MLEPVYEPLVRRDAIGVEDKQLLDEIGPERFAIREETTYTGVASQTRMFYYLALETLFGERRLMIARDVDQNLIHEIGRNFAHVVVLLGILGSHPLAKMFGSGS